jgi:hypothetical protein
MQRRTFVSALLCLPALPARADGPVDRVVGELRRLGFADIEVGRTLLGRAQIVARSPRGTREIILNPRTGEILRDLWTGEKGGAGSGLLGDSGHGNDDDDDDDDNDDDNSGPGGGG